MVKLHYHRSFSFTVCKMRDVKVLASGLYDVKLHASNLQLHKDNEHRTFFNEHRCRGGGLNIDTRCHKLVVSANMLR